MHKCKTKIDLSCEQAGDGLITTTVFGGNGGYTYSWSNGATTAGLDFLGAGAYTLTVTDQLGCRFSKLACCDASYEQTIRIEERPTADQQDFDFAPPALPMITKFQAHPNPAVERFTVQLSLKDKGTAQIRLVDTQGNDIPYSNTLTGSDEYVIRLDSRQLIPGIYFLQAEANNEIETLRLLVK